ncbi:MAG: glycosyltransferase family 2 protein [bacterium]|nr:glycosyltransferase family 2 protein [bacterium]
MSSQPCGAISVIVVNWNRRELLRECLESLRRQSVDGFEVIVVDNGSSDGSQEMVTCHYSDGMPFELKLIENTGNRGFCAANNQGVTASSGELVALLNNDAEADSGWLAALSEAFQHGEDIGMAASKILVHEDPSRIDKAGHLIYLDGQNRGRGSGELDVGQYDRTEETLWPDGCAAMYRRSLWDQIGGLDEDLFAYADDAEFGLRARIAGWRCLYVPTAVVRHHRGATLGVLSTRRVELIERNRILMVAKLFPWSLLWQNGAYYIARLAAGAWAAVTNQGEVRRFPGLKGKWRLAMAMIRGDLAALKMLPRFLRKRRQVEKLRKLSPKQVRKLLKLHKISLKNLSRQAI